MNEKEAKELAEEIRKKFDHVLFPIDVSVEQCINGEWKIEII